MISPKVRFSMLDEVSISIHVHLERGAYPSACLPPSRGGRGAALPGRRRAAGAMTATPVSSLELYNLLQAQKNWPSGGPPVLLDARSAAAFTKRMIRGAHSASVTAEGAVAVAGAPRCWWDQTVCVYGDAEEGAPEENALLDALCRDGQARDLLVLTEPFSSFRKAFPFLSARGDSSKASKRPSYPSCIVPDLLYLGDLADASALGTLREVLTRTLTATLTLTLTLTRARTRARARNRTRTRCSTCKCV